MNDASTPSTPAATIRANKSRNLRPPLGSSALSDLNLENDEDLSQESASPHFPSRNPLTPTPRRTISQTYAMTTPERERIDVEAGLPQVGKPTSPAPPKSALSSSQLDRLPATIYVVIWIALSSAVILYNKYLLYSLGFHYPVLLTTFHLTFATIATQILAYTTNTLSPRPPATPRFLTTSILPLSVLFSASLIASNKAYLHLSVAFIQMLKATTPVAVLFITWLLIPPYVPPRLLTFLNVLAIVFGIMMASWGEIQFDKLGFFYQSCGILFEASRLVLVQRLLGKEKMDPLVSLYFFAPLCAVLNMVIFLLVEAKSVRIEDIERVGGLHLALNCVVAFALNVAVVLLIGRTSSLVLTLSGVLKDIILVSSSVLIWGTTVTPTQIVGYGIALAGLIGYKLGSGMDGRAVAFMALACFAAILWVGYSQSVRW